jgi:H/ACA ribonucleoprotein complex subunit 4
MEDFERTVNFGFINLDKSQGPTSFSISSFVRRKLNLKKTSHLGTLDPKVTGVLPVALGRACKLTGYFMTHDKTYVGILHTHKKQEIENLKNLINKNFIGKIEQIPPHKSAVARKPRIREVFFWNLLEESEDGRNFLFECKVEGGTYIRKLCSDLGEMIGGAHMDELRRTAAGFFSEKEIHRLTEFDSAAKKMKSGDNSELQKLIIPAEVLIKKRFPVIQVDKEHLRPLLIGKPLLRRYISNEDSLKGMKENDLFAIFSGDRFIEIARFFGKGEFLAKSDYVYN